MVDGEDARILQQIDFLKVRWDSTDLDLTTARTAALRTLIERIGAQRVVLERAESEAAIDFALSIGLRLMQGFGVTGHVQAMRLKEHDRTAARTSRTARQTPEPEAEAVGPRSSLRKMFRL